jgi:hypothetical protein
MKSFITYIAEAGQKTERQETEFVNAVNGAVESNNGASITVKTKTDNIENVTGAEKYQGRQRSGSEPYTDVQLLTNRGPINLSMKGPSAPSLAGGGLRGIEEIIPGIGEKFFRAAYQHHINSGLEAGDKVPDLYGKLNDQDKNLLVIGNRAMGGPIDYMYIGPMDVKYSIEEDVLSVNGSLIEAKKYANSKDLYFRLRARRVDQTFDPDAKTRTGVPKIYGKSPSKGDSAGRLVVTDKVPSSRNVIVF